MPLTDICFSTTRHSDVYLIQLVYSDCIPVVFIFSLYTTTINILPDPHMYFIYLSVIYYVRSFSMQGFTWVKSLPMYNIVLECNIGRYCYLIVFLIYF